MNRLCRLDEKTGSSISKSGFTGARLCLWALLGSLGLAAPASLAQQEESAPAPLPAPAPVEEAPPAEPQPQAEPPAQPPAETPPAQAQPGAGEGDAASLPEGDVLGRLEWRGIVVLGDEVQFSLHDSAAQAGFWITFNETRYGVEVAAYDPEESALVIREGDETRRLSLSGSSVAELPPEQVTAEPPELVRTPGLAAEEARLDPESLPEELAQEARRAGELWQEAIEEEPRLQEVDNHFRELRLESQRIDEAMTQVPVDAPEYQALVNRQEQLQAEERSLTEMALNEVRASPELREQVGEPLGDVLRDQLFGHPLQTRTRPPAPDDPAPAPEEDGTIADPMPEVVDDEPQVDDEILQEEPVDDAEYIEEPLQP